MEIHIFLCSPSERVAQLEGRKQQGRGHMAQPSAEATSVGGCASYLLGTWFLQATKPSSYQVIIIVALLVRNPLSHSWNGCKMWMNKWMNEYSVWEDLYPMQTNVFNVFKLQNSRKIKNAGDWKHPNKLLLPKLPHWIIFTSSLKMLGDETKYKHERKFQRWEAKLAGMHLYFQKLHGVIETKLSFENLCTA